MSRTLRTATLAATALLAGAAGAQAASLVGLTADNRLVRIDSETRRASPAVRVTGADGRLLGIDQRPQNGLLYGVTERGQIVTVDPMTGRATQVSRLDKPFESGGRAIVDFNPVANRLRLMGMSGVNFRVNVETGQVVQDGQQKYMAGSPQAGTTPRITAAAYTNSVAPPANAPAAGQPGAPSTALYTIDTLLGAYNLQAPPNDGVQQVKGMFGMGLPVQVGFDILADGQGGNSGFVLAGNTLHGINLADGKLTALGTVAGLPQGEMIDIAAMR